MLDKYINTSKEAPYIIGFYNAGVLTFEEARAALEVMQEETENQ